MTGTIKVLAGCPPPTATETPTPVFGTPTATPCGPGSIYFETEPNDTPATAMRLGSKNAVEVRRGITTSGDLDYYSFDVVSGDRMWIYVFTTLAITRNASLVTLCDSNRTAEIQQDSYGGAPT